MPSGPSKLLRPAYLPDTFTRSLYKVAPYKGCAHGCRYCDGRAERYYVEGDFERDIEIRRALPERLEAELPTVRERGMIAFGSGVTDPYQPLEAAEGLMRSLARIVADSPRAMPALVMTKSKLALRDIDLWRRVHERAGFVLLVSIMSLDESLRETMEPGASTYAERLELIRAFKAAGCIVGALAMPLLPGLSDDSASLRKLYAACEESGVDFVMPGGLTLRPGQQKELYLQTLAAFGSGVVRRTEELYREQRPSGAPTREATRELSERVSAVRREYPLPYLLPYDAFSRFLPPYDCLRLLFQDMLELYRERGIDTSALYTSAAAFDAWLVGLKRYFRRRRNHPATWLEHRFDEALHDGELEHVLMNERLSQFSKALLEGAIGFDYRNLRIAASQ